MLLWLWHRPAAAALIQLLVWELTYAANAPIKRKKKIGGVDVNKQVNK